MSVNVQHRNALPAGYRLENFRLESVLGHGGFGITYRAVDEDLQQAVAIKEYLPREVALRDRDSTVVPVSESDRETFEWGLERFLDEARTLARFRHPNIVGVRRFLRANGTAYLVMDYCEGESLENVLVRQNTLSPAQIELLLDPLLGALESLHDAGVTHRDIKPGNIYLREDGSPVLLDFGAARQALAQHSRSVTAMATPGYAAFEQYSTKGRQGPWSDIYGLGATLYRCVTGQRPPDASDRILEDEFVPSAVVAVGRFPAALLKGIDAALRVKPEDRPQDVASWRAVMGNSRATDSTRHGRAKSSRQRQTPRKTLIVLAGGLAVIPLGLLLGHVLSGLFVQHRVAPTGVLLEPHRAEQQDVDQPSATDFGAPPVEWSPPPPPVDLAAVVREAEIERLLNALDEDLAADRLTIPSGRNALERVREILELSPGHEQALEGLRQITTRYEDLIRAALARGELDRAEALLRRMDEVQPGTSRVSDVRDQILRVREEREQARSASALIAGRYRILGDSGEVVADTTTGLQWQRCSLGQTWDGRTCVGGPTAYTWDEARQAEDRVAGWRLPTIDELRTLTYCSSSQPTRFNNGQGCQGDYQQPTIELEAFPDSPSSVFWSGSPLASNSYNAWIVSFVAGYAGHDARSTGFRVRLVRGGQ